MKILIGGIWGRVQVKQWLPWNVLVMISTWMFVEIIRSR